MYRIDEKRQKLLNSIQNKTIRDTLVMYRGGGYDGCIWEWNWGIFNSEGNWINLYNSGSMGCLTVKELLRELKYRLNDEDYYLYKLNDKKLMEKFVVSFDITVIKAIDETIKTYDGDIQARCSYCEEMFSVEDLTLINWHEIGDTESETKDFICDECLSMRSCAYCGKFFSNLDDLNEDGYCEYCVEDIKEMELTKGD